MCIRDSRYNEGFNPKHFSHTFWRHANGHISRKFSFPLPDKSQRVGKYVSDPDEGQQYTQRPNYQLVSVQHGIIVYLFLYPVFYLERNVMPQHIHQLGFNHTQFWQGSFFF